MSEPVHAITVEEEPYFSSTVAFFAVCSCGSYRSVKRWTREDAERAGQRHVNRADAAARVARIREIERGLTEPMPADVTDTDAWLAWCERKRDLGVLLLGMMTESGNAEGQAAARSLIEGAQAMMAEARGDSTLLE